PRRPAERRPSGGPLRLEPQGAALQPLDEHREARHLGVGLLQGETFPVRHAAESSGSRRGSRGETCLVRPGGVGYSPPRRWPTKIRASCPAARPRHRGASTASRKPLATLQSPTSCPSFRWEASSSSRRRSTPCSSPPVRR